MKWVLHLIVTTVAMEKLGMVVESGGVYTVAAMENKINYLICRCHASVNELIGGYVSKCFCLFVPNFWKGVGDLQMIICRSVSTVCVVCTIIGDGDTQTVTAIIKFI